MIELLITINNFAHDFVSAIFIAGIILLVILAREVEKHQSSETLALYSSVSRKFSPLILISLVLIFVFGYFRLLTYDYQMPDNFAQSRVNILIIKHILLLGIVGYGAYLHFKLMKRFDDVIN